MNDPIEIANRLIKDGEGLMLTVYKDTVGKQTIGWGRNLEDKGLSHSEANLLLNNDVAEAFEKLSSEFGFFDNLSDYRKAVLADMYHNLGLAGLMKFQKMLKAIRNGDFDEAAEQIKDSQYWSQVGDRAKRNYCMMCFDTFWTKQEAKSYFTNQ